MNLSPPAAPDPELDHVYGESGPERLRTRDNAQLMPHQVAESIGKVTFHDGILIAATDKTSSTK
jgi:hypothetical protein